MSLDLLSGLLGAAEYPALAEQRHALPDQQRRLAQLAAQLDRPVLRGDPLGFQALQVTRTRRRVQQRRALTADVVDALPRRFANVELGLREVGVASAVEVMWSSFVLVSVLVAQRLKACEVVGGDVMRRVSVGGDGRGDRQCEPASHGGLAVRFDLALNPGDGVRDPGLQAGGLGCTGQQRDGLASLPPRDHGCRRRSRRTSPLIWEGCACSRCIGAAGVVRV